MLSPESFFDVSRTREASLFSGLEFVWEALPRLKAYLEENLDPNAAEIRRHGDVLQSPFAFWEGKVFRDGITFRHGDPAKGEFKVFLDGEELPDAAALYPGAALLSDDIELAPGVVVEPGALIMGPTRIGECSIVRQGAYVRGRCLVGKRCVVGHATEMKSSVMLDDAKAGHFAYIGDSILGMNTNLGAGTKLANLKLLPTPISIRIPDRAPVTIPLRKLGAILGDRCQTGCNSVTNPGTLLGKESLVTPNTTTRAHYYPPRSVVR